jgi:endonuclease/exonuclease/phosphatase family metal-dependent hydrolase
VASFNILHGEVPGKGVDLELLAKTCSALDADVLALQEVDVHAPRSGDADIPALVADATGMQAAFGEAMRLRDGGRYGNALLVRGELADVEVRTLPHVSPQRLVLPGRPRKVAEHRTAVLATAVVGEVAVSVASCHLGFYRREGKPHFTDVARSLLARPGPHVLLGDLNLRTPEVLPLAERVGLTLAGGPPTFPAWNPAVRIDHVGVAGLTIESVEAPEVPISDHRPLVVDLRYDPPPG